MYVVFLEIYLPFFDAFALIDFDAFAPLRISTPKLCNPCNQCLIHILGAKYLILRSDGYLLSEAELGFS